VKKIWNWLIYEENLMWLFISLVVIVMVMVMGMREAFVQDKIVEMKINQCIKQCLPYKSELYRGYCYCDKTREVLNDN